MHTYDSIYGVVEVDPNTGEVLQCAYKGEEQEFYTASMIKVVFADMIYKLGIDRATTIQVTKEHIVSAWGVLQLPDTPIHISLELALYLMIIISDNTATNIVLQQIQQHGDINTLIRQFYNQEIDVVDPHIQVDFENFVWGAKAKLSDFLRVITHIIYRSPHQEALKKLLRNQYIKGRWLRYLADMQTTDAGNKTWHLDDLINDCGFIEKQGRAFVYVGSVATPTQYDFEYEAENPYCKLLGKEIHQQIQHMLQAPPPATPHT